jgi:hypothetical protein
MINRHFLTRAPAVPADISGGGAVAVTYPLRVSDALSVRTWTKTLIKVDTQIEKTKPWIKRRHKPT